MVNGGLSVARRSRHGDPSALTARDSMTVAGSVARARALHLLSICFIAVATLGLMYVSVGLGFEVCRVELSHVIGGLSEIIK